MATGQKRRTRHELNSDATRAAILKAARTRFASGGYAATSLSAIVDEAEVTTGAIYHHYGDKKDLFTAVVEDLEAATMQRVMTQAARESEPWAMLETGIDATLEACLEQDIHRILFVDAPNVFGQAEWREIEKKYSYGAFLEILKRLKGLNSLRVESVEILGPILLGAMIEAASAVALARNKRAALTEARSTIRIMLAALRR